MPRHQIERGLVFQNPMGLFVGQSIPVTVSPTPAFEVTLTVCRMQATLLEYQLAGLGYGVRHPWGSVLNLFTNDIWKEWSREALLAGKFNLWPGDQAHPQNN